MPKQAQYNLQRLLEIRAQVRDKAAIYLAECRRQLALAEDELQKRQQAVTDCRDRQNKLQMQLMGKSQGGIKSGEIVRFRQHLTDLREEEKNLLSAVEDQKKQIARAEQTVEKAFIGLNEASKEAKVIEKHKENWHTEEKKKAERREQKLNDENGAIFYERNK